MCTSVKPATVGMGLTCRGTGMAVGTEICILIHTRGTPTCAPGIPLPMAFTNKTRHTHLASAASGSLQPEF